MNAAKLRKTILEKWLMACWKYSISARHKKCAGGRPIYCLIYEGKEKRNNNKKIN